MPIHDWTLVEAGIFRHFHNKWYDAMSDSLNDLLLPEDYYALIEQTTGNIRSDVLTLHAPTSNGHSDGADDQPGAPIAVATMPPQVSTKITLPRDYTVPEDKQLVIRHVTGDRVVAMIEIVSDGNKSSEDELQRFVFKAAEAIRQGVHLLVIDLHPPANRDPQGIHGAISAQLGDHSYESPSGRPFTLVSYVAMPIGTAYIETAAVGDKLPAMPLFLDEGYYVNVPLEETYATAFRGVPKRWRAALQKTA